MQVFGFKPVGFRVVPVPHSLAGRVRHVKPRAWKHESLPLEFAERPTAERLLLAVVDLGKRQGAADLQRQLQGLIGARSLLIMPRGTKFQPVRMSRRRNPSTGPWRDVVHIRVLHRSYWLTLSCGHFKSVKRSIPKCFSFGVKPRFAPKRVHCMFCKS